MTRQQTHLPLSGINCVLGIWLREGGRCGESSGEGRDVGGKSQGLNCTGNSRMIHLRYINVSTAPEKCREVRYNRERSYTVLEQSQVSATLSKSLTSWNMGFICCTS